LYHIKYSDLQGSLVVSSSIFGDQTSRLLRLDRGEVVDLDFRDLSPEFVLLDPTFLYNVNDTRFYRIASPPSQTALPARLQPGNPVGDYHVVRLK
jgi:hypothetical protein